MEASYSTLIRWRSGSTDASSPELKANPNLWIEAIHPEDREKVQEKLSELLERRQIEQEYPIVRPDGEVVWLQDRVTVVYDEDGKPQYVGGIGTDV